MSPWESQFKRVIRALKKVEQPNSDKDAELDDLYSFFQNCWHLRDWIRNDGSLPQDIRDAIIIAAEHTESLKFCADLANGSKHLKLIRSGRKGAQLWHIESILVKDAKTGEVLSQAPVGYLIGSKQGSPTPSDVIGFSRKAVQDWKDLLAAHGLNLREPIMLSVPAPRVGIDETTRRQETAITPCCDQCGAILQETAQFCANCGSAAGSHTDTKRSIVRSVGCWVGRHPTMGASLLVLFLRWLIRSNRSQ
jgi:hypothetical protein